MINEETKVIDKDTKHQISYLIGNGGFSQDINSLKKVVSDGKSKGQLEQDEIVSIEMLFSNRVKVAAEFVEKHFNNLREMVGVPELEQQLKLAHETIDQLKEENSRLQKDLAKLQQEIIAEN